MPPSAPPLLGRCTDDPTYTDAGWTCTSWAGYPCGYGGWGVDTAAQVAALQLACPVSCSDVTPVCVPPPPPPPAAPGAVCADNVAYSDGGWTCTAWAGYNCAAGGWGITGAAITNLLTNCPVSCGTCPTG